MMSRRTILPTPPQTKKADFPMVFAALTTWIVVVLCAFLIGFLALTVLQSLPAWVGGVGAIVWLFNEVF